MTTVVVCVITTIGSLIIASMRFARWLAYLRFLRWLIEKTGKPESLRDAAAAARAFNDRKSFVIETRKTDGSSEEAN